MPAESPRSTASNSMTQYQYDNSPAGCSSISNTSSTTNPSLSGSSIKRRGRGRPRKVIQTSFDEKKYEGLSANEKKYKMLRDKNNEASRRSRLNRTQKTREAGKEVRQLERRNQKLAQKFKHVKSLHDQLKVILEDMLAG